MIGTFYVMIIGITDKTVLLINMQSRWMNSIGPMQYHENLILSFKSWIKKKKTRQKVSVAIQRLNGAPVMGAVKRSYSRKCFIFMLFVKKLNLIFCLRNWIQFSLKTLVQWKLNHRVNVPIQWSNLNVLRNLPTIIMLSLPKMFQS